MATHPAASPNQPDVKAAYDQCFDGDILTIPAGTSSAWTVKLDITKAITIQGSGVGSTIIKDGMTTKSRLIEITLKGSQRTELTGIEFQDGGRVVTVGENVGIIRVNGSNADGSTFRMHHCRLNQLKGGLDFENVIGVVDHVTFDRADNAPACIYAKNASWDGGVFADKSYSDVSHWGTDRFLFVEDCTFNGANLDIGYAGSRFVFRYNNCISNYNSGHTNTNNAKLTTHGTETTGRRRGVRALEMYNNVFDASGVTGTGTTSLGELRSGSMLMHHNQAIHWAVAGPPSYGLADYRMFGQAAPIYGVVADGTQPWDVNDTSSHGFGAGVYFQSTAAAASTNVNRTPTVLVAGSAGWSTDQWAGYTLVRTTNNGNVTTQEACRIAHNTANPSSNNTITWEVVGDPKFLDTMTIASGDTIQIRKVLHSFDQPGRSGGAVLVGSTPAVPAGWPPNDQVTDPCYSFGNYLESNPASHFDFATAAPVRANEHFFNQLASWTPGTQITSGVAIGTLAQRPTTNAFTAGKPVGYWATDAVNSKDADNPGVLYVLTAANTWTEYYSPYTYPHPFTLTSVPTITSGNSFNEELSVAGQTFQVTSTGFSGAVTYTKTGALPTGVTLNSSGLISGTPTSSGTFPIVITATSGLQSDTQDFTLVVSAPTKIISLTGPLAFGNVDINTTSTKTLTITNSGNTALAISSITLPSGFTANFSSGTVPAGGSIQVTVTFSPIAATTYSGTVTVASDKTSGTNTIAASGTGVTRVIALSGDLAFGDVTTGQTATRQLTVTNNGTVALAVSGVSYPTGFSGNYAGGNIAAGASVLVDITFSPLLAQAYSGNVSLTSNKTSGTNTIAASGTGVASATKIVELSGSMAFGSVLDGTTLTKALTITNSGNATLTVTDVTLPSGYTSDWSAGTIAAGASQVANITFAPVAAVTYNGSVTVVSDATGGVAAANITGTGVASSTKILALSGSMNFGNVSINTTVTRVLTLTNSGTAVLTVSSITLPTGFTGSFAGTINPGASQAVNVTFSPLLGQLYSGTISVASDKTSGTNTISASGTGVVPATRVIVLSGDLAFGNVQKNHTAQRTFTIVNNGTGVLTVSNITSPTGFTTDITTASIPAGASHNVVVTFAPTSQIDYGGAITVVSNKTSGVNTIACSGKGTNKRTVPFFLIVG